MRIVVTDDERLPIRLDRYLADELTDVSRSKMSAAIRDGKITVNGIKVKASYPVQPDDLLVFDADVFDTPPILAEDVKLCILYEDCDLLVVNKPANMVVHPTLHIRSGTLVNALFGLSVPLSTLGGDERPGIVHRLDQDTTGCIIVAKNDRAHADLKKQFQERTVKKIYHAILEGVWNVSDEVIDLPIGRSPANRKKMAVADDGKEARSTLHMLRKSTEYTHMAVDLHTGRTHQIRVHCAHFGHPVLGDTLYGRKKSKIKVSHQMLHCMELSFHRPSDGKLICITAPYDAEMEEVLNKIQWVL